MDIYIYINLHLTACSGDKYCMASACICKLESILLFSDNINCLCCSKFLKGKSESFKINHNLYTKCIIYFGSDGSMDFTHSTGLPASDFNSFLLSSSKLFTCPFYEYILSVKK